MNLKGETDMYGGINSDIKPCEVVTMKKQFETGMSLDDIEVEDIMVEEVY